MSNTKAMTLVEVLVALAVGLMTLAAIVTLVLSVRKMEHAGDVSGALQESALAMAIIQEDLVQAVQKPDPNVESAVVVKPDSAQMLRGIMNPDGSLGAKAVTYKKVLTSGGNFRLRRFYGTEQSFLPGTYRSVQFLHVGGAGGPYIRATLRVAVHDTQIKGPVAKGSEEVVISALVRIQGPEMVGSSAFDWKFMNLLNLIPFLF